MTNIIGIHNTEFTHLFSLAKKPFGIPEERLTRVNMTNFSKKI